jgi:hypothetical protein
MSHGVHTLFVFLSVVAVLGLPALALADAPAGRYTITDGGTPKGTVYDKKTKLIWQQAAPSTRYSWAGAKNYCAQDAAASLGGSGWRLPTVKELLSIVDHSRLNPAVDTTVFSLALGDWYYWSSSRNGGSSTGAWTVNFEAGSPNPEPTTSGTYAVLCVR